MTRLEAQQYLSHKKVYLKKLTGKGAGHNEGGHYETFNRSDGFICRRN